MIEDLAVHRIIDAEIVYKESDKWIELLCTNTKGQEFSFTMFLAEPDNLHEILSKIKKPKVW